MQLRTRVMIHLNGLLLVTVLLISGLTLFTTVQGLRETARTNALGTAALLASAASMTVQAPQEVEALISDQMVAQARLVAHLVAVADTRAHLAPSEINAILAEVTAHSVLNEIWVAGPDGVARLSFPRPKPGQGEFQFLPDPALQPQAHVFCKLLEDQTGAAAIIQKAQPRAQDGQMFKYVGVSSVEKDKPRIVQVGYRAGFINRLTSKFGAQRLVENVINAGSLEAVFVVEPDGQLKTWSSAGDSQRLVDEYYKEVEVMALETIQTLKQSVRFRGDSVEAAVPLTGFSGKPGALICRLSTLELHQATASALRDVIILSIAGLFAGALVSGILAKRVSGPIHKLAEAARAIGAGGFSHRVRIESDDEVGKLAQSFNAMADSLEANTAHLARATAEKEVLARELDIAADIQKSLLPESCPQIPNFDLAAVSVPAREVGGDFYDFIPLPDGRWGVVIADVSGKGVPAALLMALSRSLIRAYSQEHPSVLSAMRLANSFMMGDIRSGMFVTCFYAVIDPVRRSLTYVNAGHNPPVVTKAAGHVVLLPASGTPLGVIEESGVREETCQLDPGDTVLMYTDGITEAVDEYGEQFGMKRLEEIVRNASRLTAAEISDRVLAAVRAYTTGQSQFDDMTTVVLRVI